VERKLIYDVRQIEEQLFELDLTQSQTQVAIHQQLYCRFEPRLLLGRELYETRPARARLAYFDESRPESGKLLAEDCAFAAPQLVPRAALPKQAV
jgi:hypothetical protein